MSLTVEVWDDDYGSPAVIARLGSVADLVSIWENPGGIIQFAATASRPGYQAYQVYKEWLNQRLIIYDGLCSQVILDGKIADAGFLRGRASLLCLGPWVHMFDDYEQDNPGAVNNDDAIATAISDHAANISSDTSNITDLGSTASVNGFTLPAQGMHPGRLVEEFMAMGDGSGNPLVFWLQPAPLGEDHKPQKPVAYLEAVSASDDIDWFIWGRDKVRGLSVLRRDVADLATSMTAIYDNAGVPTETAAATNNTGTYGTRKRAISARGMFDAASAAHIRDVELAKLSNPRRRHEFVLGSRQIKALGGIRKPLWRMLVSGGYIADYGARPTTGMLSSTLDYERVGRITSMRYDHALRQMWVALDTRLEVDAVLAKFGYQWRNTEQLQRELIPFYS